MLLNQGVDYVCVFMSDVSKKAIITRGKDELGKRV
jgi:hypothetical protein